MFSLVSSCLSSILISIWFGSSIFSIDELGFKFRLSKGISELVESIPEFINSLEC